MEAFYKMLALLTDFIEFIENIPIYILSGIETFINAFFAMIQLALEGANALLGGLPEVITPPSYISEINWYYPVGYMLTIVTPLISFYVVWLGISWIYRKFGAL